MKLRRRPLLLGLAGSLTSAAFTRRIFADPAPPPPKRLVLVMQTNGTQQGSFWPDANFQSPILAPILSNPRLRERTTAVRGLYVPWDAAGTDANEHDMGFARMFTGHRLMNIAGHPWGGGPSIDQIVAKAWREPTLNLACLTSRYEPFPKPGFLHRRSFSYVAPGVLKVPIEDPLLAYKRLFAPPAEQTEETRRRLATRRSVLDLVQADLADARDRVSREDRDRLDRHTEGIRQLERDLTRSLQGEALGCALRPQTPFDYTTGAPRKLVDDESDIPAIMSSMVDLAAIAITCGAPRIATLQFGYGGAKWGFDWEGIGENVHAELSHRDTSDEGSSPENTEKLVRVNRWYAKMIARLATQLDAMPEGEGTVLDNTLIVWANEFGRGDHSMLNVPTLFIGGAGMPRGPRLVDEGGQPFHRLGVSILRAMGLAAGGFGDMPDCGPIRGL